MSKLQLSLSRRLLLSAGGAFVLVAAACGPVHVDPRWASVSVLGDQQQIALAFGDRLTLIDPVDGRPVELLDADGEVRLDDTGNPRLWEVRSPDNQQTRFYVPPVALDEETLLVASYDKRFFEVDVPVARVNTTTPVDEHIVASLAADATHIYVPLSEGDVVALDRDDLSQVWRFDTQYGVWAQPLLVGGDAAAEDAEATAEADSSTEDESAAPEAAVLYVTSMDHFLYALDPETGDVLWRTDLQGAVTAQPLYVDGQLYIGSFARKLFQVSAADGSITAEYATDDWVWSTPAYAEGVVYAADMSGSVYALTVDGGLTQLWKTKVAGRAIPGTPLVAADVVVVGSRDNNVYWVDRETGAVVDTKQVAGEVLADPVMVMPTEANNLEEPIIVVNTAAPQEMLVAFTLDRGQRVWVYGR